MALYGFRDTTASPAVTPPVPAEAMMINGNYIETLIDGYTTLYATGREILSQEVNTEDVGKRSGSVYVYRRYPARVITIGYQLLADDAEDFRDKYNALSEILDVENATLIFADESDKFFIGTPNGADKPDAGVTNVTAEFTILCTDPFKYSATEYTVSPDSDGIFTVNYNEIGRAHV